MKRLLALFFCSLMLLFLAACNGTAAEEEPQLTEDETTQMNDDEITEMYSDPDAFQGRQIMLIGQLSAEPENVSDQGIYFQMYNGLESNNQVTFVGYENTDISLTSNDYVKVIGVVDGAIEYKSLFDYTLTAPLIIASSIEKVSYIDALSPTIKSVEINSTQEQYGLKFTLQKVEFSPIETRVYLSLTNNSSAEYLFSSDTDATIKQGSFEYVEQTNYEANYQEIQYTIDSGSTTEGIIAFPAMEQSNFTFYIDGELISIDGVEPNPFVFDVAVSE